MDEVTEWYDDIRCASRSWNCPRSTIRGRPRYDLLPLGQQVFGAAMFLVGQIDYWSADTRSMSTFWIAPSSY